MSIATSNLKHDSGDSPCRICNDTVYRPDGIMCDRCECWVHSAQKCSELTQDQLKFLVKNKNVAIKFICSKCRVEFPDKMLAPLDAVARQAVKIDTFGEAIATLQQQNKEIIDYVKKATKTDNSIKVQVSEAIHVQREKDERKHNIILYNIPEADKKAPPAQAELEDIQKVKNVLNFVCPTMDVSSLNGKIVTRCGNKRVPNEKFPNPKPRPIKIELQSPSEVSQLKRNARKLKDNEALNHVGISEDKPWKERMEERELRKELSKRRSEGEDVVISIQDKKVILRSELPSKKKGVDTGAVTLSASLEGAGEVTVHQD